MSEPLIIQSGGQQPIVIQTGAPVTVQPRLASPSVVIAYSGPPGANGGAASATLTLTAATALSGQRAVSLNGAGQVVYFNASQPGVIGLTTEAVGSGQPVSVQIQDVLEEPTWNWTPGLPVYAGTNGVLSQTPPSSGYLVVVGVALTSTKLRIEPEPPVSMI